MADLDELPRGSRTRPTGGVPALPERNPVGLRGDTGYPGPYYDEYLGMRPGQLQFASDDIKVHLAAWQAARDELHMARAALTFMQTKGEPPYLAVGPQIWKLHEEAIDLMWDHLGDGYRIAGAIHDTLVAIDKSFRTALDAEYASGKALLEDVRPGTDGAR